MFDDFSDFVKKIGVPLCSAATAIIGYRLLTSVDRPLLVGGSLVLGAGTFGSGGLLLRRFWKRRREHRQAVAEPATLPSDSDAAEIKALQKGWKEALRFLKASRLKSAGDPLYVLPWYMVIGESGSGKSTAIRRAGLSSFGDARGSSHCEWSFFEQAIVLDVAGEYVMPANGDDRRAAWHALLDLLFKHRKKESLNGVVMTVSSGKLMRASSEELEKEGRLFRRRLDEIMRALGAKLPIYLLVTQCDRVEGMTRFTDCLSDRGRRQPMGGLNQTAGVHATDFLRSTLQLVVTQLKRLRLAIAGGADAAALESDLLLFPEKLGGLEQGLKSFVQGAFQENPYQETPLLRGLFFGGAEFFLNELFSQVLPNDRWLFTPTRRALQWRRGTFTLGVTCWMALMAMIAGVMSYSFLENLTLLRQANRQFASLPALQGNPAVDIPVLESTDDELLAFEAKQHAWLPTFGFHQLTRAERWLEQKLSTQFRNEILAPLDAVNEHSMGRLTAFSSNKVFSQQIAHLVARVSLLREKLRGADAQTLLALPPPPDIKEKFGRLYLISLAWNTDGAQVSKELATLLSHLKPLLMLKANSPAWVIDWANAQDSVAPVTLADYWGAGPRGIGDPSVPAIFSLKDKGMIESFFAEIALALDDPAAFNELKGKFEGWYRREALESWRRFIIDFPRGAERLRNRDAWRRMAVKVSTPEGPYFHLVNDVALQLEPFAGPDAPPWLNRVFQFHQLQTPISTGKMAGLARKYASHGEASTALPFEVFATYRQSIDKLAAMAADRTQTAAAVSQAFGDGSAGDSPFGMSLDALLKLKNNFPSTTADETSVFKLMSGPFDFLWDGALRDVADALQNDWETKVLSGVAGLKGSQAATALLAPEGPALRFAKEQAAAYIQWKPGRGFCAKYAFGNTLPLRGALFYFLNQSGKEIAQAKVANADVTVTALAPETNVGAKRIPHLTKLDLNCGGAPQILSNRRQRVIEKSFNVEVKKFNWSPSCSDTTLEIDVGDSRLIKHYPGAYGFLTFLNDFKEGQHVFHRDSFPDQASALAAMGIDTVLMHYRIQGAPDFSPSDVTITANAPTRIAEGWNE